MLVEEEIFERKVVKKKPLDSKEVLGKKLTPYD